MKTINQSIRIIDNINGDNIINKLETIARVCYQSEAKEGVYIGNLIRNCIKSGHESVIEHESISFDLITDIGVLAELTRHRLASFSVESTRYCKYDDMEFIIPIEFHNNTENEGYKLWKSACESVEKSYGDMMNLNLKPDISRAVINKSLKTEIIFTMNMRELRSMLKLRCEKHAHAHIKQVMIPLLLVLKEKIPIIFDDIDYDHQFVQDYLSYYYDESHDTIYTYPTSLISLSRPHP